MLVNARDNDLNHSNVNKTDRFFINLVTLRPTLRQKNDATSNVVFSSCITILKDYDYNLDNYKMWVGLNIFIHLPNSLKLITSSRY